MTKLATKILGPAADAVAPDRSEVRLLVSLPRGSMAHFTLRPGTVSRAVAHRTVEEVWYFLRGHGYLWWRFGAEERTIEIFAGVSIAIPTGACFQFRCDDDEPLEAVGVTMPPWPRAEEAVTVEGIWAPTV